MIDLFGPVYDKFIADGKYGLTNLYDTEAPERIVYPYATFGVASSKPEWTFNEDSENSLFQITLFSDEPTHAVISAIFLVLDAKFHKKDLTVEGGETVSMVREVANRFKVEKIWRYNILYRIVLQEN